MMSSVLDWIMNPRGGAGIHNSLKRRIGEGARIINPGSNWQQNTGLDRIKSFIRPNLGNQKGPNSPQY